VTVAVLSHFEHDRPAAARDGARQSSVGLREREARPNRELKSTRGELGGGEPKLRGIWPHVDRADRDPTFKLGWGPR
jgi:hypothetical protein